MTARPATISLVGGFAVSDPAGQGGLLRSIPARRLLAYLAVEGGPRARHHVAFTLWPESDEPRAIQNLRTAIYEVRARAPSVLTVQRDEVSIASGVEVDLSNLRRMARSIQGVRPDMAEWLIDRLGGELLPDWYDDWIIIQRERWLQARLHALDSLAAWLTANGMHALAIDAAITSVMIEPFREGGRRALIGAYLAEGDPVAAAREFRRFGDLLRQDLALAPSRDLASFARMLPIGDEH